jgi:hypothetical protein
MTTMTRGLRDMSPSPTLKTVAIEFDEGIVVELHVAEDYGDDDILLVAEIISDHLASGAPYEELNIGQVMEDILAAGPGDGTYIDPEDLIHVDMSNSFEMIVDPSLHKYLGQINSTDGDTSDRFRRYSISPAFYRIVVEFKHRVMAVIQSERILKENEILLVIKTISNHLESGAPLQELNVVEGVERILTRDSSEDIDLVRAYALLCFQQTRIIFRPGAQEILDQLKPTDRKTSWRSHRYSRRF